MGLFDRLKNAMGERAGTSADARAQARPAERVKVLPDPGDAPLEELPLKPEGRRLTEDERAHVEAGLAALEAEGVDVDDLGSISDGLDRALAAWTSNQGQDHDEIVARYAIGIGEHLHRHTDLAWEMVTDVFGTDLAVAAGDFVVVPGNLVAVRWMRRETGWVPRVVGHLVKLRTE